MTESFLQIVLREGWSWVIRIMPMPWRGSLAAVLLLYVLFLLFWRIAPWGLIAILYLAQGGAWLLRRVLLGIEMIISEKASGGQKLTDLLAAFSGAVDWSVIRFNKMTEASLTFLQNLKTKPWHPRPLWFIPALALAPAVYYIGQRGRDGFGDTAIYQFARQGLGWWHSCEHYFLSGTLPAPSPDYECVQRSTPHVVKSGETLTRIAKLYGVRHEEIILDNPDELPPKLSLALQKMGIVSKAAPSPDPTALPLRSDVNNLQPGLKLKIPLRERASITKTPVTSNSTPTMPAPPRP